MAEVAGAKVRSPLAETTNRVNSPFPPFEQQPHGKHRHDHADARHAQAYGQAPARRAVPNPMAENHRPSTAHGAHTQAPAVLSPPKQGDDDKRFSQASYASSSSSRSKKNYKTHVGPWQLGRTLGKGSSARVRLCRHNITRQLAAVKIVNRRMAYLVQDSSLAALSKWDSSLPEQINGEMRVPMAIEREVAILKLIEHPNIMRLYDIWENRSEIYLILEYIDQGIFSPSSTPMGACIKIADFGMAALHQTDTHHLATACGSPHYAAPELLKNRQYRGDRADIWSLGVILYAMLSATLPFDDPDLRVMMAKTKKGHYEMPRGISPEAADLIRRMLQVNPDRRITLKEIWRHPLVQKYNYTDDFGDITGQLPDTRKGFQYSPVLRSEIDPQLLRQLRSMWHMFSEQDLVLKLTCDEPNDQKAFYWLLYNYRDKQLEDFKPELAHSMSDYHHLKPTIWKKKVSTCEFAQPRANGHGRSVSRFTVISNAAETEAGTTDKSYDPYRGSRMLQGCEPEASHAKIVIHRDAETISVKSTTRARSGSNARRARANSAKAASIMAKQPSRGSLLSLRSNRQGTPHVAIPALRHKRGVDFSHVRRRSTSAGYAKRPPTRLRTTASVAGDGSMYQKEAARSLSPELPQQADGTHRKANGAKKNGASMIFNEELRHFSNSCAKDCDEAFKGTLAEAESAAGSWTDVEKKDRGSTPFSMTVDSPTVATPATETSSASWQTRPLPPLPTEDVSKTFLTPSLRDVESELDFGGDERSDAASVTHDGPRVAVPVLLSKHTDRRVVSAPVYNHQPGRKLVTLPSIHENTASAVDNDGARVVSAPPHGSGKRSSDADRSLNYLSKVENTIRVVHSPGSTSPVKMPEPLNVQKKSATEDLGHKLHRHLAYNAGSTDDNATASLGADANTDTKKKKTSWFRRVSKAESEAASTELKGPRSSIASKQSSEADAAIPATKKKAFSFPFWKSNKGRETGMVVDGPVRATEDKMAAKQTRQRELHDSGSGSIRNVAVKQNWLTRLFRVKPATSYICMTLSRKRARQEITILLREWKRYGMTAIQVDKQRNIVFARLGAKNYLNLKEVDFAAEVMTVIEHGKKQPLSIVRFTQERGAASSLHRIVDTMRIMFDTRHLVVADKEKQKMMIKTLNA
ncbi:CAMK/CAMKL/GIN4 protein kinase [Purpureocillium lavendulum]|uniref:non-specific serine/threonine protein kinase n=1 Tax=Purpureocillium lavendulum TaxID=1247861 RepID=A0AB34FY02_9HYPO|nr:CAMK/CAMKL/GIN4 protein kinase [Purpureocillium lavendulum]